MQLKGNKTPSSSAESRASAIEMLRAHKNLELSWHFLGMRILGLRADCLI